MQVMHFSRWSSNYYNRMSQHGYQQTFTSSHHREGTMDLYIETLTGTAFEMTVSPFDTVMSIKSKIQRVEGKIPAVWIIGTVTCSFVVCWCHFASCCRYPSITPTSLVQPSRIRWFSLSHRLCHSRWCYTEVSIVHARWTH